LLDRSNFAAARTRYIPHKNTIFVNYLFRVDINAPGYVDDKQCRNPFLGIRFSPGLLPIPLSLPALAVLFG
jgi:hypothetical protein